MRNSKHVTQFYQHAVELHSDDVTLTRRVSLSSLERLLPKLKFRFHVGTTGSAPKWYVLQRLG